ncbi:hypothetical protein P170DRAFT_456348 [Aspergillus steynii IBT 23096]|uniref:VOC domain-containing protein n=1 Tax=Aspergillus steynii IBT 23096 TaxID=1392250 RepID=A0A2I2G3L1_9EURO|nr:uncharacterized protein P170DRAFT_456348 [Aspergillus steynii IBT 23096]PLB47465.1 hypothetical protein P170DRAFT_456348 [Aspergillus steynii IBT 23096]
MTRPPPLSHLLETCIYVRDVRTSSQFYQHALNLQPFSETDRSAGFALGPITLLLFGLGKTVSDVETEGGSIPRHGPSPQLLSQFLSDHGEGIALRQHFCLAVRDRSEVQQWDLHLQAQEVPILSRVDWERGGRSVYFKDPDGNVVEIGSRGIWPHY